FDDLQRQGEPDLSGFQWLDLRHAVEQAPEPLDFVLPVAPGLTSAPTVPDLKPGKTKSSGSGACSTACRRS
ncbi:hypothetical protein, partial [Aeromonas caviae]|uniref:hypothetical protein n=1 Tax=Aeromonas caviae TaxID=648 RepID=UPI0022A6CF24